MLAAIISLGSLAAMVGLAPAAHAATLSDISVTSNPAADLQLEVEGPPATWTPVGAARADTAATTFSDVAAGTYRVVATQGGCRAGYVCRDVDPAAGPNHVFLGCVNP